MTPHPENATLAAFLDGKLAGAERQRVVEHLADCTECYEVFVGTARFLEEEGKGGVLPWPGTRRPWWRRRRGLTAAAAGVAAIALLVQAQGRTGPPSSAQRLVAALSDQAAEADNPLPGRVSALGFAPESDRDPAARWLGAQFLEVRAGLRSSEPKAAAAPAAGLAGALSDLGQPADGDVARRLAEALLAGRRPEDAHRDLDSLERRVARRFPPQQLAFGAWADASRRAAAAEDAAFFNGPVYRDFRRGIDERSLPDAARKQLHDIDVKLADGLDRRPAGPTSHVRGAGSGEGDDLAYAFEQLILIER
jgi:putative zinc finger protein